jgi:ArsR family transcriptional regulator
MNDQIKTLFETRAKIIKALAHPTRLFIANHLTKQECCVCNLTDMVGVDISTVSKHLAILKEAGIVEDEKRGMQVCYRIRMTCIKDFLACIDRVLAKNNKIREQ